MAKCVGLKKNGEKCNGSAWKKSPSGHCWYCENRKPKGAKNGRYRGKSRTAYIGAPRLLARATEMLDNPRKHDLDDEIVMLQVRLTDITETIKDYEGECSPFQAWDIIKTLLRDIKRVAFNFGSDPNSRAEFWETINRIEPLLEFCSENQRGWDEYYRVVELLGRTQERQSKLEDKYGETVRAVDLVLLFVGLQNLIIDTVESDDERSRLGAGLRRIFNRPEIPQKTRERYQMAKIKPELPKDEPFNDGSTMDYLQLSPPIDVEAVEKDEN